MSKTRIRRSWAVLAVFGMAAAVSLVGAATSSADANFGFSRLQGSDRYDTARDVAIKTFGTSDLVVIASGETFPDALSAAYAAGLGKAPILLTKADTLPSSTKTALTTLAAKSAVIVGGTSAVSANVETELKDSGLSVTRLAGSTRYATAVEVAKSGGASNIGKTGGPVPPASPTAIVVSGESYADALSAGPASDAAKLPILLTAEAGLANETKTFLGDSTYGIKTVLIVGGKSAVSQAVEDEIKAMSITVTRLAGADRMDTAAKVADYELANLTFSKAHVDLARGDSFADALSAAPHAGKTPAPLLLTQDPTTLGSPTKTWLSGHKADLKDGHIFGGTGAVSTAVETEAETAAGNTTGSTTTTSSSSTTTTTLPGTSSDEPGNPTLLSAVVNPKSTTQPSTTITLNFSEAVTCASVDANGSDFTLTVNGSPMNETVACSGTSNKTATMTPASDFTNSGAVTNYSGKVTSKNGGDGDTVKDLGGNFEATGESVSFPVGPTMLSASAGPNNSSALLVYDQTIDCTTVSNTDFQMTDYGTKDPRTDSTAQGTPVLVTAASCSGTTDTVAVTRLGSYVAGNFYKIALAPGGAVANKKGDQEQSGDFIVFKASS